MSAAADYIDAGLVRKQPAHARRGRFLRVVVLASLVASTSGCRPGYLMQVGLEHLRYMGRARPIAEEIARTADPERRAKLELVLEVRRFAAAQGMDVGGSYLKVADTTGLATAYVVTAAHQDRLEPYQWSYPVVGKIPYRGYFDRGEAEAFGRSLEADGFDTYVVEAAGYSTLGWLDDPLPSGLLDYDFVGLAEVILHELVHQTLFVPGHIDFNETLASAVAGRLTTEFFVERGETERADLASRRHRRWLEEAAALDVLVEHLERYFSAQVGAERSVLLAGRARIYEDASPRLAALGLEVRAPHEPGKPAVINNAVLLSWRRYRRRAAAFDVYLGGFPSVARAFDQLRSATEDVDDPFTALEPRGG